MPRKSVSNRELKAKAYYKRKEKCDANAAKTPQALAWRYYQFRLSKAPTAPYLMWTNGRADDKRWYCRKAPVQTIEHVFKRCAIVAR
ncbi:hypothetical protein FN846DRAFT_911806 [Sphaerosporella brunnea]|uniref:Uncharacterized protein n=1 Tax=Sphaerosporella brunnea TaxID=1250544 RepID=A0A5J5EJL6_9PEZI|nr:hypothetical protein FN846DRAFT_911806 [Sphaerosporella brunnea]